MNLLFNIELANSYTNPSQKIRVLSEDWVKDQIYCPNCGHKQINEYVNNKPVADFFCTSCSEDYELKSSKNQFGSKVVDGAYSTMIQRLSNTTNPNFFLLRYSLADFSVQDLIVVPKHFFVPEIIEKRAPLSTTARRAGWQGCNILLSRIPEAGKIFFIRDRQIQPKEVVINDWRKVLFLREEHELTLRGWVLDVMLCIEKSGKQSFSLSDVYKYENYLSKLHPNNRHIKDKIRQQLQILRDNSYLEFLGGGQYRLT